MCVCALNCPRGKYFVRDLKLMRLLPHTAQQFYIFSHESMKNYHSSSVLWGRDGLRLHRARLLIINLNTFSCSRCVLVCARWRSSLDNVPLFSSRKHERWLAYGNYSGIPHITYHSNPAHISSFSPLWNTPLKCHDEHDKKKSFFMMILEIFLQLLSAVHGSWRGVEISSEINDKSCRRCCLDAMTQQSVRFMHM
jgi:hypothetical protein